LLLLGHAEFIVHNPVLLDHQPVAEQRGPAELAQQRRGKLLEGIRQDDDLDLGAERIEELPGPGERVQCADDLLDIGELQAVLLQELEPAAHELVVVRLIAGGPAQRGDARLFRNGNPNLGSQHSLHVQGYDALFHRAQRLRRRRKKQCGSVRH